MSKRLRAVITGATGFIGSALCTELLNKGWEVSAIIRPNSNNISKIPNGAKKIFLNLEDIQLLDAQFDVFYHLAWNGAGGESREDFCKQKKNIIFSEMALRAAKKCGCKKFIGAGTQVEYGVVKEVCTEETITKPFMMYGAAKLSTFHMCSILAKQLNIEFLWPRIYSVYGEGENPGTLMSYLVSTLIKGEIPELTSCENMWDFLYVTDCACALRLLGEQNLYDKQGIYNISYGAPQKLKSFVKQVRDIINPSVGIKFGARDSSPDRTFWLEPNITRLQESTGFTPEVDFDHGVRMMIKGD